MAIKQRITATTELVSRWDEAISPIDQQEVLEYCKEVDIKILGDLSRLEIRPSIFEVSPLKCDHEYLVKEENINYWAIFSTHVISVTELPFKLVKAADGSIDSTMRSMFPMNVVQDIAEMIIVLASGGKDVNFFTVQGDLRVYLNHLTTAKSHIVKELKAQAVPSKPVASKTVAKVKKQKQVKTR